MTVQWGHPRGRSLSASDWRVRRSAEPATASGCCQRQSHQRRPLLPSTHSPSCWLGPACTVWRVATCCGPSSRSSAKAAGWSGEATSRRGRRDRPTGGRQARSNEAGSEGDTGTGMRAGLVLCLVASEGAEVLAKREMRASHQAATCRGPKETPHRTNWSGRNRKKLMYIRPGPRLSCRVVSSLRVLS